MRGPVSVAALAVIACGAALAQSGPPAVITISAPASYVLSGRTIPLVPLAVNQFGTTIDNYVPAWKSNTPAIANVDSTGLVTAMAPGMAEIEADDPNSSLSATIRIAVYAGRIAISPEIPEVFTGSQLKLNATAYDADDNPISGVVFGWRSALPGLATVDDSGVVSGAQSGRVTISAAIQSDAPDYLASSDASVLVRRRPDYNVSRVLLPAKGTVTIRDFSGLSVSKNDKISYIAQLSTGAQAVVLLENGVPKTIATSGQYIPEIDAVAGRFEGTAVNSNGDVLVQVDMHTDYCERAIVIFTAKGGRGVIGPTFNCDYNVSQRSFSDAGDFVAWHNEQGTGLKAYAYRADGSVQTILAFGDSLPGIGHINNTGYPISAGENGSVYFIAQGDNGNRGAFLWDGKSVKALVTTGSAAGLTVTDVFDVKEAAAGDFYIFVHTSNNGSAVLRYTNGQLTQTATNGSNIAGLTLSWVQTNGDARPSGVLVPAINNKGNSFLRLGSPAAWFGSYPYWTDLTNTFITSKGAMIAALAMTAGGNRQIVLVDETGTKVLAAAGDTWGGTAPEAVAWEMAVRGMPADSTVIRASSESIHTIAAGAITSTISPGDVVTGTGPLTTINGQRAGRSGAIFIEGTRAGGEGIFLAKNGAITKLAERWTNDKTTNGLQYSWFGWGQFQMAINSKDQVAVYGGLSNGANGILMFDSPGSTGRPIMMENTTLTDGSRIQNIWGFAMDDSARMLIWGPSPKGQLLVFWDGQTSRKVLETGVEIAPGLSYNGVASAQGVGNTFYIHANFPVQPWSGFFKYDGARLTSILIPNDPLSIPPQLTSIPGNEFGVNSRGDLAYFGTSSSNDRFLAVRMADGTDKLVAWEFDRSPANEWFLLFSSVSISDSGVVYFIDSSWNNAQRQVALHRAVPQ
jgi:hypothetical protein